MTSRRQCERSRCNTCRSASRAGCRSPSAHNALAAASLHSATVCTRCACHLLSRRSSKRYIPRLPEPPSRLTTNTVRINSRDKFLPKYTGKSASIKSDKRQQKIFVLELWLIEVWGLCPNYWGPCPPPIAPHKR